MSQPVALRAKIAQGEVGSFHMNKVCNKPAVGKPSLLGWVGLGGPQRQNHLPRRPLEITLPTLPALVTL